MSPSQISNGGRCVGKRPAKTNLCKNSSIYGEKNWNSFLFKRWGKTQNHSHISKKRPEGGIGKPSSADQRVSLHPALWQLHHLPCRQLYVEILTSTVFIFYFVLTWPSMEDDSKRRTKNISGKKSLFQQSVCYRLLSWCLGTVHFPYLELCDLVQILKREIIFHGQL